MSGLTVLLLVLPFPLAGDSISTPVDAKEQRIIIRKVPKVTQAD